MGKDYDQILEVVGEWGLWQKILFALTWFPTAASAMAVFLFEFMAYTPDLRCRVPICDDGFESPQLTSDFMDFAFPNVGTNDTVSQSCQMFKVIGTDCSVASFNSNVLQPCLDGYVYDKSLVQTTAAIDFELVCEDTWKKSMSQSSYMIGMMFGSIVVGTLCDRLGRRWGLTISTVIYLVGGLTNASLPASSDFYLLFALCRFTSGCGHIGLLVSAFSLAVEYIGAKKRIFCGMLFGVPYALGGLLVAVIAWAGARQWRTLQYLCTAPWILLFLLHWIMPESPRWLLAKGRLQQLETDVKFTSKVNKKPFPTTLMDEIKKDCEDRASSTEVDNEKRGRTERVGMIHLFRPFEMCLRTLIAFFNWIVCTLCYYALTSFATSFSKDIYINYSLTILVEIPAYVGSIWFLDHCGRKRTTVFCQVISGVACMVAAFLTLPWLQVLLVLVGKLCTTAAFMILFVYTAEIFPTAIRSTAVGASSMAGRVGGFLAPLIGYLSSFWKPLPLIMMGSAGVVAGLLIWLKFPETSGQNLPTTMNEALNLGRNKAGGGEGQEKTSNAHELEPLS